MNVTQEDSMDWKPSPNICRCCLSEGCYKDISSVYYFSGEKEVYEEILKETLYIEIPYQPSVSSRLICEDCIARLRDARVFKQTILRSEAVLQQYYNTLEHVSDISTDADLGVEVKLERLEHCEVNDEECADSASLDDNEILADIKMEVASMDEAEEEDRERRSKRKSSRVKNSKNKQDEEECDTQENWMKIAERRGTGPILRENSLKLLANSTMCIFQWNKSWYRCFCCQEAFPDMAELREHNENAHSLTDIRKKIILQQNKLVKVDVSDLTCKICDTPIESLAKLRVHLSSHGIKFELNEDLLVPFKIEENLQCQICAENFSRFRLLNIHMNKHFQKQVCHICGAAFSNLVFLNLHKTRSHRPLNCKYCEIIFANKTDKKRHEMTVHNVKFERKLRFPCPYCSERFFQENLRVLHLVEKHNQPKPEHKCLVCEKTFVTRSLCNNHMKNVHMKEKNHECDVCHNLFYTKSDVARHRVTHTGEKRFSCNLCSNLFATKDSLRRHMKRTHVGLH